MLVAAALGKEVQTLTSQGHDPEQRESKPTSKTHGGTIGKVGVAQSSAEFSAV